MDTNLCLISSSKRIKLQHILITIHNTCIHKSSLSSLFLKTITIAPASSIARLKIEDIFIIMPRPSSSDLDNIDPSAGKAINDKIHHDLNPEQQHGGLSHNKGQPKRPPHATATGEEEEVLRPFGPIVPKNTVKVSSASNGIIRIALPVKTFFRRTNCVGKKKMKRFGQPTIAARMATVDGFGNHHKRRRQVNKVLRLLSFQILSLVIEMEWVPCLLSVEAFRSFHRIPTTTRRSYSAVSTTKFVEQEQQQPFLSLLSFDLDDTFWPTTDVVYHANAKMIQTLHDYGCNDADIDSFLQQTRSIRKQQQQHVPVTYQSLRKLAIRKTLETSPSFESNLPRLLSFNQSRTCLEDTIVEDCYKAWEQERHNAAERFLFEDALETMQRLRQRYPNTCFVAVTNGAGDPFAMTRTLAPFFDFRISGEDDGIFPHRKPHPFIYQKTLQQSRTQRRRSDTDHDNNNNKDPMDDDNGIWCHVGDCLANDVGASADCGAKAIWICPLEEEGSTATQSLDDITTATMIPTWSTATTEEMERRAQQMKEGRSKMAASITSLSQLPSAIARILQTETSN
ncbi:haloacid dehalogenase-like hydrolase [Nitzschia inconspicua]|uniref:Haloacid dehalogenase-like hydrolase n=1 Tax=Nitzschia inconspicua TaxID=303405 RepID=A0A9K3PCN9_9STRA|nr:haloacid dehalogenase-like hydrolase [Nitzschia inconspicua]